MKTRTSDGNRFLHRVLTDAQSGEVVDHINGDGYDNRLENLRLVDHTHNQTNRHGLDGQNTSGFRGVSWCRFKGKWRAYATKYGKFFSGGYYDSAEDAAGASSALREKLGFLS